MTQQRKSAWDGQQIKNRKRMAKYQQFERGFYVLTYFVFGEFHDGTGWIPQYTRKTSNERLARKFCKLWVQKGEGMFLEQTELPE